MNTSKSPGFKRKPGRGKLVKKWYEEEYEFQISVLKVGEDNRPENCRIGLEVGDEFSCQYSTPAGFCPTSFIKIFPLMEVLRCKGDLRTYGSKKELETTMICPDGVVVFKLKGKKIDHCP